ncbi:MAG: shikimate dehydrogenase family protein [Bacteroidales bacterium]
MKYGLIGYPISHSKSPELFRAAYPDRPEMTYDLIEEDDFERAYRRFEKDYEAVNVTAPFKGDAFRKVDIADTIARELYAVNILKKKDGKIYGYNSDFWALKKMLAPYAQPGKRTKVLVIGCGGAAKAAALAALKLRMSVTVANRDFRKAREFCFTGGGMIPVRLEQAAELAGLMDILIYTLPLRTDLVDRLPLEGRVVVEPNYKDPCLREMCEAAGATYISGMDWLGEQAIAGYQLMTGIEPDAERVKACCAKTK